jgi:hypothetical protein
VGKAVFHNIPAANLIMIDKITSHNRFRGSFSTSVALTPNQQPASNPTHSRLVSRKLLTPWISWKSEDTQARSSTLIRVRNTPAMRMASSLLLDEAVFSCISR